MQYYLFQIVHVPAISENVNDLNLNDVTENKKTFGVGLRKKVFTVNKITRTHKHTYSTYT